MLHSIFIIMGIGLFTEVEIIGMNYIKFRSATDSALQR